MHSVFETVQEKLAELILVFDPFRAEAILPNFDLSLYFGSDPCHCWCRAPRKHILTDRNFRVRSRFLACTACRRVVPCSHPCCFLLMSPSPLDSHMCSHRYCHCVRRWRCSGCCCPMGLVCAQKRAPWSRSVRIVCPPILHVTIHLPALAPDTCPVCV
jgi:hypothetical protein